MWLPSLMSAHDDGNHPPTADEEAQWRALFDRPQLEFLLRGAISCNLGERAGELYLGSHALHFRASAGTLQERARGKSKERTSVSVPYARIGKLSKKSGKRTGYKGFVIELAPLCLRKNA